jgi:hypothetical protein
MKNHNLEKIDYNNYSFFFIQGNGLKYIEELINILLSNDDKFDLILIRNYKKKFFNLNFFAYFKLNTEIKHLIKKSKKGAFIFIKFRNTSDLKDVTNKQRCINDKIVSNCEKNIRDRFDKNKSKLENKNSIIYGCSDGLNSHYVLKYLGYNNGLSTFSRHDNKPFKIPFYLEDFNKYKIHEIEVSDLICNTFLKSSINIKETPHYKFLQGLENEYKNYLEFYYKMPDVSSYSIKKYKDLSKNFEYLCKENETNYIIVKKVNNKYMILDGLHRASLSIYKKKPKLIVLEIL